MNIKTLVPSWGLKTCAVGLGIVIGFTPLALAAPALAAAPGLEQAASAGLFSLGTETVTTPQGGEVTVERFMPELRDARIQGTAVPETNGPGDEITIDLRSLVGGFEYDAATGELLRIPGSAERAPQTVVDPAGRIVFAPGIDWSAFSWRINGLENTGVVSHLADSSGSLTLIPRAENATFGATVALVHLASGAEGAPVTITGQSGTNGSAADWLTTSDRVGGDGNAAMWRAAERGFQEGKFLSWSEPEETTLAEAPSWNSSPRPWVEIPLSGRTLAPLTTPAGFGLEQWEDGGVQPLGIRTAARVGQAHSEPVGSFEVDLAERVPELGITALALPGAPNGTLTLDTASAWVQPFGIGGLDYQAASGLALTVDGTTVRGQFGSAEWTNAVGVTVFVLTSAGVQAVELRIEARPADVSAGLVEKRVKTGTELLIPDEELLEASRLSGLTPTMKEIEAVELPEGVSRVNGGFRYAGAAEPTALTFAFSVSETLDTPFGPVRPDAVREPGEVRIEVFEETVPPSEPEEPVTPTEPEEPQPEPTDPETPVEKSEAQTPAGPVEKSEPEAPSTLARTGGSDLTWLVAPAALLLVGGAALALTRRRPEVAAE